MSDETKTTVEETEKTAAEIRQEAVETIVDATLTSAAYVALTLRMAKGDKEVDPGDIAHDVVGQLLYQLAKCKEVDSVRVTLDIEHPDADHDAARTEILYDYHNDHSKDAQAQAAGKLRKTAAAVN